ncbi:hypothetical protein ACFFX0_10750 [Citricoccus parietis]|uniref:Uncharacterized protein n=1 Tax=Citricoccus parietis TaxID=592307 RepID=A0ABV5FY98_9MICC
MDDGGQPGEGRRQGLTGQRAGRPQGGRPTRPAPGFGTVDPQGDLEVIGCISEGGLPLRESEKATAFWWIVEGLHRVARQSHLGRRNGSPDGLQDLVQHREGDSGRMSGGFPLQDRGRVRDRGTCRPRCRVRLVGKGRQHGSPVPTAAVVGDGHGGELAQGLGAGQAMHDGSGGLLQQCRQVTERELVQRREWGGP